jgi:hypothetical protein
MSQRSLLTEKLIDVPPAVVNMQNDDVSAVLAV